MMLGMGEVEMRDVGVDVDVSNKSGRKDGKKLEERKERERKGEEMEGVERG